VGEERRRGGEQGEMRGSLAPTAVFKSRRLRGPQAHRSVPGPPQTTMAMRYVSVAPNIYPSNAVYVELASLSYCIDAFYYYFTFTLGSKDPEAEC